MQKIKALDTFAGTGWGVACRWLNIEEDGVEIMPEAVATREANGMTTIYRDVWDGILLSKDEHEAKYGTYDLKISSPPCQTFSVAGSGAGRRALDEVIEAIQMHAYKDPQELLAFGRKYDMRTALVLTPLAYIWRDMPRLVALEQVPTVLPVWEAYAEIMTGLGYSVKTAVLNAEQYGVPQTRRRAILVARLDGDVQLPKPTHSRYYSRNPEKLDPGVKKWISMADALGWGRTVPSPTYCNSGHGGAGIEWGGNSVRKAMREQSISGNGWIRKDDVTPGTNDAIRVSPADAAALQSYPVVFRNGNQANSAKRTPEQPAPTIHFSARSNKVEWMDPELADVPAASGQRVTVGEAAALQSYPAAWDAPAPTVAGDPRLAPRGCKHPKEGCCSSYPGKPGKQFPEGTVTLTVEQASALQTFPTPTMVGFPRLSDGKAEVNIDGTAYRARDLRPAGEPALTITEKARSWKVFSADGTERRITTAEAGVLQTFEEPFQWRGAKTKQYLQIGNAVPPLLARAVLSALIAEQN
jgi:DNA (cytosine-5)-methyltransferase 1